MMVDLDGQLLRFNKKQSGNLRCSDTNDHETMIQMIIR